MPKFNVTLHKVIPTGATSADTETATTQIQAQSQAEAEQWASKNPDKIADLKWTKLAAPTVIKGNAAVTTTSVAEVGADTKDQDQVSTKDQAEARVVKTGEEALGGNTTATKHMGPFAKGAEVTQRPVKTAAGAVPTALPEPVDGSKISPGPNGQNTGAVNGGRVLTSAADMNRLQAEDARLKREQSDVEAEEQEISTETTGSVAGLGIIKGGPTTVPGTTGTVTGNADTGATGANGTTEPGTAAGSTSLGQAQPAAGDAGPGTTGTGGATMSVGTAAGS